MGLCRDFYGWVIIENLLPRPVHYGDLPAPGDRYDLFQEHTYTNACLNRLLHNSYRLEMNGKNMRDLTPLNK